VNTCDCWTVWIWLANCTPALAMLYKLSFLVFLHWARICKRLQSPGINSEESILPAYVAWRPIIQNRVVVPARLQPGNRFLGSLKGLQIQTLHSWLSMMKDQSAITPRVYPANRNEKDFRTGHLLIHSSTYIVKLPSQHPLPLQLSSADIHPEC
jgi:hypothetical protein